MEAKHTGSTKKSILKYLAFSRQHQKLAEEIADDTIRHYADMLAEGPRKLSREQQVALAVRACIRHNYTAYDDLFIEKTALQTDPLTDTAEVDTRRGAEDQVSEFVRLHRRER